VVSPLVFVEELDLLWKVNPDDGSFTTFSNENSSICGTLADLRFNIGTNNLTFPNPMKPLQNQENYNQRKFGVNNNIYSCSNGFNIWNWLTSASGTAWFWCAVGGVVILLGSIVVISCILKKSKKNNSKTYYTEKIALMQHHT